MATREEMLKRFDHGDGADVGDYDCPVHGHTYALYIYNQGGHDCTISCLACSAELYTLCRTEPITDSQSGTEG